MRNETALITQITDLSRQSNSLEGAIARFQPALAGEIGGSALLVEPAEESVSFWAVKSISGLMDSRVFPFRGLYTAPLMVGRTKVGRLVACFGSFGAPGMTLSNLTAHIAQQLGEILSRTRDTPIRYVTPLSNSPAEASR